jgi:hypothetical protein
MTGTPPVIQKLRQGIANRVAFIEITPFTRHLEVDWKFGNDKIGN